MKIFSRIFFFQKCKINRREKSSPNKGKPGCRKMIFNLNELLNFLL
jgi:hypothetical protein